MMEHTETLAAMACGCSIIEREQIAELSPTYYTITYCPLHKAAPDMKEALKNVKLILTGGRNVIVFEGYKFIDEVLAKAEGK